MARITKAQSKIMKAHLEASMADKFDFENYPTIEREGHNYLDFDKIKFLISEGKTIRQLFEEIEARYCSTGSMIMSKLMKHSSNNYGADLRRGFRIFLSKYFSIA